MLCTAGAMIVSRGGDKGEPTRDKGGDAFKYFSTRLRDAASTTEDYDLWKTREIDDVRLTT